ncbi:MAG TPA: PIG-L family deacetylase [Terriglobia bacterium]|nr:PIG-L family deacetylase [Terriglobia bacterium]
MRITACLSLVAAFLFASAPSVSGAISMQGASTEPGYNAGSVAIIRARLTGAADPDRYDAFADVGYAGSKTSSAIVLTHGGATGAEVAYEGRWPIPADAATGLYTVAFRVEDHSSHNAVASVKAPGFFVYKKLLRITNVSLDKTFYAPGDRIGCEIRIENLTGHEIKGLRVEFSNENYPWISTFAGEANAADKMAVSPSLGLLVLRESLDLPAHGQATLPMQPAGTAAFLQGSQVAIMGAGGPARHAQVAPPEADRYTIAVWDHDRKNLLDMQFSPQVIVREPGRVLPKPYSRNFTHPYNEEIDFSKYREFYPPGHASPMISLDESHTLYTPGDDFELKAKIRAPLPESGGLHFEIRDEQVREVWTSDVVPAMDKKSGVMDLAHAWSIPASIKPGVYTLVAAAGAPPSVANGLVGSMELAINKLPASLMVFCPHEDDEHPWAGLMRAMVEAGRPVRVVFYTGGDVGECERYFDGHPCDPVRAREFGTVRMEESTEALEHIGVKRDQDIFLGLPDGGSGEIWFRHLQATNPFLSIYLAVDHAPYEHLFEPNLPYARDAVVDAVKRVITEFRPAMIAVSHPDERHVDHRTANWFTLKACQELLREGRIDPGTVVLADQAYGSGGFKAAPYQYEKYVVYLSGEAAALKQEMGWLYQSQDGNLEEGSKRTYSELPRQELHYRITDWQQHEGWNE